MKSIIALSVTAASLLSPVFACAQSTTEPITRAQVRDDLIRLERAGYQSSTNDENYPADAQAAEAKAAAKEAQSGMGMPASGQTESGSPMHAPAVAPKSCVGPLSFCDTFFGG
ncbi:DUF4148 domain-containing protein [Trinickia sp.]|uniref:DUF4148 domain-containing protein n=1 Tax=Trinickia sp. TaxID=2571163 RepID=UPI003F7FF4B3